ncbi:lipase family protein [Hydrogenophaga sp. ZJX-1]|uniref:lipase family protein n=1 Tax=Hydrogenophaga sp. ZJX-1 TaxID=3404778 RepID=UPI003B283A23
MNADAKTEKGLPNRLDARIGMRLAYWAYEHKDIQGAEKVAKYPEPWRYAESGDDLPASYKPLVKDPTTGQVTQEGWNTQHNADGQLENQFKVSINDKTHEISFDFKGSDAWSNWKSDLGNAGASEFTKIQEQAQRAFEALRNDERYKDYRFAATGHSLGGGMAQSFALRNNIDAYVYNSLPIARETIRGDYFKDAGGYDAALARYQALGRQVHDVRTPNDIATYNYEGVWQGQYLSRRMGQEPTVLPGPSVPKFLKTALVLSGSGTLVAGAIMGQDHANQALFNAQQGLSVNAQGRYRIPEGHADFARVPPEARQLFAKLGGSPVIKASCVATSDDVSPFDRFHIRHEDGSMEHIGVNTRTGDVEIDHYDKRGQRTLIEMNGRRAQPARVTEFDAEGQPVKTETVAMREGAPPSGHEQTRMAQAAPALSPGQQAQFSQAYRQTSEALQRQGLTPTQISQVCAAAVAHCARVDQGEPERFLVSKDGQRLGVVHEGRILSEMPIAPALARSTEAHLVQAAQQRETTPAVNEQAQASQHVASAPQTPAPVRI